MQITIGRRTDTVRLTEWKEDMETTLEVEKRIDDKCNASNKSHRMEWNGIGGTEEWV